LSSFVVDASVAAAWLLPEEATAYTEAMLAATAAGGAWVPALLLLEIGNLLLNAHRRRRIDAAKRIELVMAAAALPLRVDSVVLDLVALDTLALACDLTTYDATYLELAQRRALPLATLDRKLLAAMRRAGVPQAAP
jgi:predicted nucleic acid-binding protein